MAAAPAPAPAPVAKKQAVVIIHGIGEQVPMDTLRGFVNTVWDSDPTVCDPNHRNPQDRSPKSWSKPDEISGDFELRRITTNFNKNDVRTDFFEFYWAHMMNETKMAQVLAWARGLLIRSPSRVPRQLRPVWLLLVVLSALIAAGSAFREWPEKVWNWLGWPMALLPFATAAVAMLWIVIAGFLITYAGDAARYLHVRPPNIDVRHKIRIAGVDLLRKLHAVDPRTGQPKYERIVIVGHSLGSVIGYDILTYFWQSCHAKLQPQGAQPAAALQRLEVHALTAAGGKLSADTYRADQPAYFAELRNQQCPWLVTDFVTLGSPLAHAEILLAKNYASLVSKQGRREVPKCPPELENNRFAFQVNGHGPWMPHHAALFGPTRWTNLFFPSSWAILGDPIGGPLQPVFGLGVKDVDVTTKQRFKCLHPHSLLDSAVRH
jgi:hypothetical protein